MSNHTYTFISYLSSVHHKNPNCTRSIKTVWGDTVHRNIAINKLLKEAAYNCPRKCNSPREGVIEDGVRRGAGVHETREVLLQEVVLDPPLRHLSLHLRGEHSPTWQGDKFLLCIN